MQALVLAAGMGRRLGRYTRDRTKCMVHLNGEPLIDRMLSGLSRAGIKHAVVVVGYKGSGVKSALGSSRCGVDITYVENRDFASTNNIYSLYLAREHLLRDDTLIVESDLVFDPQVISGMLASPQPNIVAVTTLQPWMKGTVVRIGCGGDALGFASTDDIAGEWTAYYKTANIYKFSKEFSRGTYVPFLQAHIQAGSVDQYFEAVLRVIADFNLCKLSTYMVPLGSWWEIDDWNDLDAASAVFESAQRKHRGMQNRYGGYWRFPHLTDLCYPVNPFFPPEELLSELKQRCSGLIRSYPSGARTVDALASEVFGCGTGRLVVGNGSAELISALCSTLKGRSAVAVPVFGEYVDRTGDEGPLLCPPSGQELRHTTADLYEAARDNEVIVLVNPNNPTGAFIPKGEILRLATDLSREGKLLVIDESFVDFTDDGQANSLLQDETLEKHRSLVVIKSISKSYGIPGLRLGLLATSRKGLCESIRQALPIWNVNSLAECFLQLLPKYLEEYWHSCALVVRERAWLVRQLQARTRVHVLPSQANFLLCKTCLGVSATDLAFHLLEDHGLLVKDCTGKAGLPGSGSSYIRVSVSNRQTNEELVRSISEFSAGCSDVGARGVERQSS